MGAHHLEFIELPRQLTLGLEDIHAIGSTIREKIFCIEQKKVNGGVYYAKRKLDGQRAKEQNSMMKISYRKLWHTLIDKAMTKSDLQKAARLSWGTISRMNRGENIGTDVLLRICEALKCDIVDIMEINSTTTNEDKQ